MKNNKMNKKSTSDLAVWSVRIAVFVLSFASGWFLPPILNQNQFGIYILLFISFFIPVIYFFLKYLFKQENSILLICSFFLIFMLFVFPFSMSYHHIKSDYYLFFTIPFLLNSTVSFDIISEKKILSVDDLNNLILEYFPYIPLFSGILLLFKTVTNTTNPPFTELSVERKAFLIFKILYLIGLFFIFLSIKSKYFKQGKRTIFEFLLTLFLMCTYVFTSIYMFLYKNYLDGSYKSYAIEFTKFLAMTTMLIITVILYEKQTIHREATRKIYFFSIAIYSSLIAIPIALDLLEKFMPFLSNTLFNKPESYISIVTSSILASLITSILLKITVERNKKAQDNVKNVTNEN